MVRKFEYKLCHLTFQLIFIFLKQIIFSRCSCDRDNPIYNNNLCQLIYCTENEFQSNICRIDNDIIKTQWLNNFIDFKEYRYRFTTLLVNDEGDLILFSSPEELNGQRLFYRITKDGRPYYKNNNNEEIFSKNKIVLDGDNNGALRYESQVFLIKVVNDNYDENRQFLVSISLFQGFMEIYDIDNNDIPFSIVSIYDFCDIEIYSRKGSIIELDNKQYLYFLSGKNYKTGAFYLSLKKFQFFDINLNKDNINEKCIIEDKKLIGIQFSRIQSAFKTEQNKIILFYLSFDFDYKIEVLNETYHTQYEKDYGKPNNYNGENSIFFKGINLKENIGVFVYYMDTYYYHPKILICDFGETDSTTKFDSELGEYEYNTDVLLNDVIKINNKRFSFISTSQDRLILYIVLFDVYNNDQNIKLRFYKINLYHLYNYKIHKEISSNLYNNCLALSLSVCNSMQCEDKDTDNFFTTLLIFSYINKKDFNINITSYFSEIENTDNDDIYLNFPDLQIDNNIFGYQIIQQIKIISIPNEINLYKIENDNTKTQININDEYSPNMKIMINPKNNILKTDATYYIEYQFQCSEPDYNTFNQYPDKIIDYPESITVSQETEFNNDRHTYEKRLKIEFNLCNDYCKTCKSIGKSSEQTKCEECKDDLKYYLDENSNTYTCFPKNEDCPIDSPFLIAGNNLKCEKSCNISEIESGKCILDNSSPEALNKAYSMLTDLISTQYNNEDIVLRTDDDLVFQLSNSANEITHLNDKERYYNLSIIDLGECETKLKNANSIPLEVSLIIFKIESYYENTTIKNVQYEIYNPDTKTKITDMSPCDEEKIDIYVQTNLDNNTYALYQEIKNQGYDIFNPNDDFYNDICTKYTSVNGTDMTLNDRKELIYDESKIFCQDNCDYKGINTETSLARCQCSATSSEISFESKQFSGIEIITSFYDVIKFSNFIVLSCYNLVFSSDGIKKNYGFIIMLIYIIFFMIMLIIFIFTGMKKIRDQLSKAIYCSVNKLNTVSTNEQKNEKLNEIRHSILPQAPKKKIIKKKKIVRKKTKKSSYNLKNKQNKSISENLRKNSSSWGLNGKKNSLNIIFTKKKKSKQLDSPLTIFTKGKGTTNQIYSEFELDDLDYLEAIRYDKRTLFEFYMCLVKREHLIVFTFIFCGDLNLLCIKLALFIFSVSLDFSTNVLFFNDDSMHKIYLDYGKYNFVSQIPQIIYSTVISETFDVFLKYLCLSEKEIYLAKKYSNLSTAVEEVKKIVSKLKKKFFIFFVVCTLLMMFFLYFITAFCAVYENTQIVLINDSIFSLTISLLYPFVLYFIPAILRIISLRSQKKDQRLLYKISNIFPLF